MGMLEMDWAGGQREELHWAGGVQSGRPTDPSTHGVVCNGSWGGRGVVIAAEAKFFFFFQLSGFVLLCLCNNVFNFDQHVNSN